MNNFTQKLLFFASRYQVNNRIQSRLKEVESPRKGRPLDKGVKMLTQSAVLLNPKLWHVIDNINIK